MLKTFKLNKKNKIWFNNLPELNRDKFANELLELGYTIKNCIQTNFCFNDSPIYNRFQNLENIIKNQEKILNTSIIHLSDNLTFKTEDICNQIKSNNKSLDNVKLGFDKGVDKVTESVFKLVGDTKVSSIKGKIGENFIENTINQFFPDDSIIINAKKKHESDILFIENDSNIKILIE